MVSVEADAAAISKTSESVPNEGCAMRQEEEELAFIARATWRDRAAMRALRALRAGLAYGGF